MAICGGLIMTNLKDHNNLMIFLFVCITIVVLISSLIIERKTSEQEKTNYDRIENMTNIIVEKQLETQLWESGVSCKIETILNITYWNKTKNNTQYFNVRDGTEFACDVSMTYEQYNWWYNDIETDLPVERLFIINSDIIVRGYTINGIGQCKVTEYIEQCVTKFGEIK